MIRVKSNTGKIKRKLRSYSGFLSSNLYRISNQKYIRSLTNQYVSRKVKKRFFRKRWIKFISSTLKENGQKYSLFIFSLKKQKIILNRKILYLLIIYDLYSKLFTKSK